MMQPTQNTPLNEDIRDIRSEFLRNALVTQDTKNVKMEVQKEEDHQKKEKRWEKVTLNEKTELYMEMKTAELSLRNPEADEKWEMYKSTSTEKVAHYCEQNGGRNGPRDITKSKEEDIKERATVIINECRKEEQEKEEEAGESHLHFKGGNREGIQEGGEEINKNQSEHLL